VSEDEYGQTQHNISLSIDRYHTYVTLRRRREWCCDCCTCCCYSIVLLVYIQTNETSNDILNRTQHNGKLSIQGPCFGGRGSGLYRRDGSIQSGKTVHSIQCTVVRFHSVQHNREFSTERLISSKNRLSSVSLRRG
jgi:hypothetical protein